jgi:hypothetical protein
MKAGVSRLRSFRYSWIPRFRVSVCIALCFIVFNQSRESTAETDIACPSPRLSVALSERGRYSAAAEELWGDSDLLAYDLMTRMSIDGLRQGQRLGELVVSVGDALRRLHLAFPETRVFPTLEYRKLALQVKFAGKTQDGLDALRPTSQGGAVRVAKLPGPFSEALGSFCEQLCECWVQVEADGTARMYFPMFVNLVYAIRQLRTYPDVTSVSLVKTTSPHLTSESPTWKNLSVQSVGNEYYFTITTLRLGQVTERSFYHATSSQVRLIEANQAAKMPEFHASLLPADVWP